MEPAGGVRRAHHLLSSPLAGERRRRGVELPSHEPRASAHSGFTYLGLLFAIAIMGATLAATGEVWHTAQQREKERELLFTGNQFRRAIALYYERTPGAAKQYPRKLEDLLKDNRYPTTQRYLRKVYPDPMTGTTEWGLVQAPEGGIAGVYSVSEQAPLKVANFDRRNTTFAGKASYSEWKFVYVPAQVLTKGAPAGQTGAVSPSVPTPSPGPAAR